MDEQAIEELRLLRTLVWVLPLVVSVVVALISGLSSYLIARGSMRSSSRLELLAVKRRLYVELYMSLIHVDLAKERERVMPGGERTIAQVAASKDALERIAAVQLIAPKQIRDFLQKNMPLAQGMQDGQRLIVALQELMLEDTIDSQEKLAGR